jgi:hypothetical protein
MKDVDLDQALDRDTQIAPSADFTARVMTAVRREDAGRDLGLDVSVQQTLLASPWLATVAAFTAVIVTVPFLPAALTAIPNDEASRAVILTLLGTALLVRWSTRPFYRR